MVKLPKLPKGWILKSKRDGYAFWGDRKNDKDFTIISIFEDDRGGWSVEKQHSTFFGERRMLAQKVTKQKAISRAYSYMRKHKR